MMNRKGSRKESPLLKNIAKRNEVGKRNDQQMKDNLGFDSSDEENRNDRKMLVSHEGIDLGQTTVSAGKQAKKNRQRKISGNLSEHTQANLYSSLSRTNKNQIDEVSHKNNNINPVETQQETLDKQNDSTLDNNTKKKENLYSTLKKPQSSGLYNPYAVDNTNIADHLSRKMDDKQTKTTCNNSVIDTKTPENDYSKLNRKTPTLPARTEGELVVGARQHAVENDYSTLHRPPAKKIQSQLKGNDAEKTIQDPKSQNEGLYAMVVRAKKPETTYDTLERTLSQENILSRASWPSNESLLYNPYAVDSTEPESLSSKRNIINPIYNHVLENSRVVNHNFPLSGTGSVTSVYHGNNSGTDFEGAHMNFGFDLYENEGDLYSELTAFQEGARAPKDERKESSELSDKFCPSIRFWQQYYWTPLMLFIILFLSVMALLFMILTTAGKVGPSCLDGCKGASQQQLSESPPDDSYLLDLMKELTINVSVCNTSSRNVMQQSLPFHFAFIQEEMKVNRTLLDLTRKNAENSQNFEAVNMSILSGVTQLTTKVETSLESLKSTNSLLHDVNDNLNLSVLADKLGLQQRVKDSEDSLALMYSEVDKINSTLPVKDAELKNTVENWNQTIPTMHVAIADTVQSTTAEIYRQLKLVNSTQTIKDSVLSNSLESLSNHVGAFNTSLTIKMENWKKNLDTTDAKIRSTILTMNTTLNNKIFEISNMRGPNGTIGFTGPKGPKGEQGDTGKHGPVDFTSCSYKFRETSNGNLPTDEQLPDTHSSLTGQTIVAIMCSSNKDHISNRLERRSDRWVCHCGLHGSTDTGKCRIHYWICPTS